MDGGILGGQLIGSVCLLVVLGLGQEHIAVGLRALELGVALRKRYGIRIESVTDEVRAHFANVRSLAQFIRGERGERQ